MCIREFHAVLRNVNQKTDTRGMFQTDFQNYLQNKDRSKAGDDMQGSLKEQICMLRLKFGQRLCLLEFFSFLTELL